MKFVRPLKMLKNLAPSHMPTTTGPEWPQRGPGIPSMELWTDAIPRADQDALPPPPPQDPRNSVKHLDGRLDLRLAK